MGAAAAGLGLLAGIGCTVSANACPFRTSKPVTTTDGEALYLSLCVGCHGRNGEGGNGSPLIEGPAASYDIDTLIAKIRRGKPLAGMPAFGKAAVGRPALKPEQIRALAQFVMTLRPSPAATAS